MTDQPAEEVLRRELEERYLRRCALVDLVRLLLATGAIVGILALAVLLRSLLS